MLSKNLTLSWHNLVFSETKKQIVRGRKPETLHYGFYMLNKREIVKPNLNCPSPQSELV